jgi:shikimate kinase
LNCISGSGPLGRGSAGLPPGRNLALIGFMTAGKTQVGVALARLTGYPFVDIDALVEGIEEKAVHRIFAEKGEPHFRRLETTVLRDLCRGAGTIIGCGGGTVLAEENRRLLAEHCVTVWLRVSEDEVLRRLEDPASPRRPVLEGLDPGDTVARLMLARDPLYRGADLEVDTDLKTVEAVAREITLRLGLPVFEV